MDRGGADFYGRLADEAVAELFDQLDAEAFDAFAFDAFTALVPPGDCHWLRHLQLQREVNRRCKRLRACAPDMRGCSALSTGIKLNVQCANARNLINRECYRGGNPGHVAAERDAVRAAASCRRQ